MSISEQGPALPDKCPSHLVPDAPASKDQFNGPHARVALAMADVIRSERGGQSIGLSGSWGAGKSTVITLLRSALETDSNFRVWVFDAWAHEKDPLRRTFLETLIGFLSKLPGPQWVKPKRWRRRRMPRGGNR